MAAIKILGRMFGVGVKFKMFWVGVKFTEN